MEYPNFTEEKKLWKKGYKMVVGLDEAGRGPLAGPVVAAAVAVNPKFQISNFKFQIKDSKQLTAKQREFFYGLLTTHAGIQWGVGIISEKIIDKINILQATKFAMQKAIKNLFARGSCQISGDRLKSDTRCFLLIDGNFTIQQVQDKNSIARQKSVVKGDQKVFSIAAASIIAKVTRDRLMKKYHKKYPKYGFFQHKGYPTKVHFANLRKFGPCKIHRKTFYPVSEFYET